MPRNEEDGSFARESVAKTLRLVTKDVEGNIYRDSAKEMATIIEGKDLQFTYNDKYVEFLENRRRVREGFFSKQRGKCEEDYKWGLSHS